MVDIPGLSKGCLFTAPLAVKECPLTTPLGVLVPLIPWDFGRVHDCLPPYLRPQDCAPD